MKKIIAILGVTSLVFASCNKFLDINYDPNAPESEVVSTDNILPAAEMAFSAKYGDIMRIYGAYVAQQYAQYFGTSNYLDFSQFTISATRSSNPYSTVMTGCIGNATVVKEKAEAAQDWGTYLAATTLRVFAFQSMADAFGEIPYSEAMKGLDKVVNPKYDEGKDIYAGLVAELDAALAKTKSTDKVALNLLYQGQNADPWIKFANALKLKLLMRESGVVNVKSALDALVAEDNFPTADVAWAGIWANESGKANPFYQEEFATYFGSTQVNCGLNVALYRAMSDYNDARLSKFFSPNKAANAYWGSVSGDNLSTSKNYSANSYCRPAMAYDSPVYLISKAEVEFFLSEYYTGTDNAAAKNHYEAAIKASFASAGLNDTDAAAAITAYPFDATSKKNLGIQKWIALSGINNFEAWCELRRLHFPAFGGKKGSDIYNSNTDTLDDTQLTPGELYTPISVDPAVGENQILERWPYPQSSTNYNANSPDPKKPTDKVFWAE